MIYVLLAQVDEAGWRDFKKLQEQLEQDKRDMKVLTEAFIDHRAQTAADTLVCVKTCNASCATSQHHTAVGKHTASAPTSAPILTGKSTLLFGGSDSDKPLHLGFLTLIKLCILGVINSCAKTWDPTSSDPQ